MFDYEIQTDFDIKGLSLIDVSSEDDCLLIYSPIFDQINTQFSGSFDEHGKLEEDESRGNGRCNLHECLTWSSSFFSSAAFLEPEESSSMLKGNEKCEIHALPGIQEGVSKSCDVSTMLESKASRRESLEDDSVEPASYSVKKEPKTTDPKTLSSSKKLESTNKDKVMQKCAPKKPDTVKDPGKTMKQVPSRPQTSQSVGRSGVSTSSLHKPPNGVSRVVPISTTQTKRASLGIKDVKMENDAKSVTGRGTTISMTHALGDSRNTVPRPTSSRSSLNMITNDSKIAAECKSRAGRSQLSTLAKLNSSMSAASSYREWSSESSSSTSTANRMHNTLIASLGPGSPKGLVTNSDDQKVLDSQTHHTHQSDDAEITGSLAESENKVSNASTVILNRVLIKPSGLRPPSPKLAISNGLRLSGHTRNRSMPSHPSATIGLRKIGAKISNLSGSLNKAPLRNGSRNPTISTCIAPKLQNKPSPRTGRESYSKAQGTGSVQYLITDDLASKSEVQTLSHQKKLLKTRQTLVHHNTAISEITSCSRILFHNVNSPA